MNVINKVTRETLKKNKVRTLVTIIGIVLSVAMFTAVTTSVSSVQQFLIDLVVKQEGSWYGSVLNAESDISEEITTDSNVTEYTRLENLGYAQIESLNENKPYIYVNGIEGSFTELLVADVTSGRMPENSKEIILPNHLKTNGGVKYQIGDEITLSLGDRKCDGEVLTQAEPYISKESGNEETFTANEDRTYTVVGFYDRPGFEGYSSPGYTALTMSDNSSEHTYDVYVKTHKMKTIYSFLDKYSDNYSVKANSDLLRYSNESNNASFNKVLNGLAAILMGLIVFGSISLIYNAFSISVSERTKQFGILKSIGATKRQTRHAVIYEALLLGVIGIPIGIGAGILGMWITFKCVGNLMAAFINGTGVTLKLHLSVPALVIAAVIGLVTVIISAYIPSMRAAKKPAIEAIRQTNDIKIKANKVKTSKLMYLMFGFEGMLASKNFKRNRKKYRATVISLFLSVVLFISATSFCSYLSDSVKAIAGSINYDITYSLSKTDSEKYDIETVYNKIKSEDSVTDTAYIYSQSYSSDIKVTDIEKKTADLLKGYGMITDDTADLNMILYFIQDSEYEKFLNDNGYSLDEYMSTDNPKAIVYDKCLGVDNGKYTQMSILKGDVNEITYEKTIQKIDGYTLDYVENGEDGKDAFHYVNEDGEEKIFSADKATSKEVCNVGTKTENAPFFVDNNSNGNIIVMYPYSAINAVIGEKDFNTTRYFIKSDNVNKSYDALYAELGSMGLTAENLYNQAELVESNRALMAVIKIFSYGFIILISLISVANVFNTISTNIGLRRREFAMLKSVGMTKKGFNKMMNYECILYGIKGLIFGIPVGLGMTFLIYRSLQMGMNSDFYVPWINVAIAAGSVFAVVFATMLYSMSKIKKDNPVETLKQENL